MRTHKQSGARWLHRHTEYTKIDVWWREKRFMSTGFRRLCFGLFNTTTISFFFSKSQRSKETLCLCCVDQNWHTITWYSPKRFYLLVTYWICKSNFYVLCNLCHAVEWDSNSDDIRIEKTKRERKEKIEHFLAERIDGLKWMKASHVDSPVIRHFLVEMCMFVCSGLGI